MTPSLLSRLPRGATLTPESWGERHRLLGRVFWGQLPLLVLLGVVGPRTWPVVLGVVAVVAALGLVTLAGGLSRGVRAGAMGLGLIGTSFAAIDLSGGSTHLHLHLLATVGLVALYQSWAALLWTLGAILVHHLTLGLLVPERVFSAGGVGMPEMAGHSTNLPFGSVLFMVLTHAGTVGLLVAALLMIWHFAERTEAQVAEQTAAATETTLRAERDRQALLTQQAHAERANAARLAATAQQIADRISQIQQASRVSADGVTAVEAQVAELLSAAREIDRSVSELDEMARELRTV